MNKLQRHFSKAFGLMFITWLFVQALFVYSHNEANSDAKRDLLAFQDVMLWVFLGQCIVMLTYVMLKFVPIKRNVKIEIEQLHLLDNASGEIIKTIAFRVNELGNEPTELKKMVKLLHSPCILCRLLPIDIHVVLSLNDQFSKEEMDYVFDVLIGAGMVKINMNLMESNLT